MKTVTGLLCMLSFLLACTPDSEDPIPPPAEAYVPLYYKGSDVYQTAIEPSKPIVKAGKQYVSGNLLLQNEVNEGIHLLDVSNPASPRKLGFISIPICTEMAFRGGFLYCNNYNDLVVFDLTLPGSPKLVKRVQNVFSPANQDYPPYFNVAFECPDKSKGVVVGWELRQNIKALCRR